MQEHSKATPAGGPTSPVELAALVAAGAQSPTAAQELHLRMTIEGGQAAERYSFHFEASGGGLVNARMSCQMTGREARSRAAAISTEDFAGLLEAADIPKLLEVRQPMYRIPPCSMLGRIEVSARQQRMSFVFMADRAQAEQAGMTPSPELARLVDRVFEVSAKYVDAGEAKSLRP